MTFFCILMNFFCIQKKMTPKSKHGKNWKSFVSQLYMLLYIWGYKTQETFHLFLERGVSIAA